MIQINPIPYNWLIALVFSNLYIPPTISYLLMRPDSLSYKVSYRACSAVCIPMVSCDMFFCPLCLPQFIGKSRARLTNVATLSHTQLFKFKLIKIQYILIIQYLSHTSLISSSQYLHRASSYYAGLCREFFYRHRNFYWTAVLTYFQVCFGGSGRV